MQRQRGEFLRLAEPARLIDINRLTELDFVTREDDGTLVRRPFNPATMRPTGE